MSPPLNLLILAAGAGKRLGNLPKCLIHLNGQTLLERLLAACASLNAQHTVAVLGHHGSAIQSAMSQWPLASRVHTTVNPEPGEDPSSSLRSGLQYLGLQAAHCPTMVLLADQPLLTSADLQAPWRAFQNLAEHQEVLWPIVQGQPGHPVIMSAKVAQILSEGGLPSLKAWRQQHPTTVCTWHTTSAHHTIDLDTENDLQTLRRETGLDWQLPLEQQASLCAPVAASTGTIRQKLIKSQQ